MMYSDTDVRGCIQSLATDLGVQYPHPLQEDYEAGLYPHLLSYEKVEKAKPVITALEKYIIGASSFLGQPHHFYDIFRACRHVTLIQPLSRAVRELITQKVVGHEEKLDALKTATDYDEFESILFELVSTWRYMRSSFVSKVEFIPQTPQHRTPDLRVILVDAIETFCEFKKLDRTSDYAARLRNDVRDRLNPVITSLREDGISFLGEISFHDDPASISAARIEGACRASINSGSPIIESDFQIVARRLPAYVSETYKLYPSPDYYWGRYQFRARGEWYGIVHQIFAKYADHIGAVSGRARGMSTWLEDVSWDAAIKWKIASPELVAKQRRFSFSTIFSGLEQINGKGFEGVLHVWLETEYCLTNRRDAMIDLTRRCWVPATRCRVPRTLTFAMSDAKLYQQGTLTPQVRFQRQLKFPFLVIFLFLECSSVALPRGQLQQRPPLNILQQPKTRKRIIPI
jgi:hypothetical protein